MVVLVELPKDKDEIYVSHTYIDGFPFFELYFFLAPKRLGEWRLPGPWPRKYHKI